MNSTQRLAESVDGAKLVETRQDWGVAFGWHGGHSVHVYSLNDGREVDYFNVGSFEVSHADRADVVQGIEDYMDQLREEYK